MSVQSLDRRTADRRFDLSLSERAIHDIALRVTGRRMAHRELLRAFAALDWTTTLESDWFYVWSPKPGDLHDLIVELEQQLEKIANELC